MVFSSRLSAFYRRNNFSLFILQVSSITAFNDFSASVFSFCHLLFVKHSFKRARKILVIICFVVPMLIIFYITYDNTFDGVFIASPELVRWLWFEKIKKRTKKFFRRGQRSLFWNDEMYLKIHIPAHTNADCYLTGLLVGLGYKTLKLNNFNIINSKVRH
jgi:hypothetical protein